MKNSYTKKHYFFERVGCVRAYFFPKTAKTLQKVPLALSSHSVWLRKRCEAGTGRNSLKTTVL